MNTKPQHTSANVEKPVTAMSGWVMLPIHLDDERKASMVSNLLVVLCAESEVSPVVNAGTLYH